MREYAQYFRRFVQVTLVATSAILICVPACRSNDGSDSATTTSTLLPPFVKRVATHGYNPPAASPLSNQGESIYKDLNCAACHAIHNVGGHIGPMLDGIGSRMSSSDIAAKLAGRSHNQGHVVLSAKSAASIAAYLVTVPEPAGGYIVEGHGRIPADNAASNKSYKPAAKSASSAEGKLLFEQSGCMACHSVAARGGWLGPRLDGVGGRRDRAFLIKHMSEKPSGDIAIDSESEQKVISSKMPPLSLSSEQARKIADFLETLPNP